MGGLFSALDVCKNDVESPAAYMEQLEKRKMKLQYYAQGKRKPDVIGMSINKAMKDIKHIVGVHSDDENENTQNEETKDIKSSRQRYYKLKWTDSDGTNYERSGYDDNTSIRSKVNGE